MNAIRAPRFLVVCQRLQLLLDLRNRIGVQQLAQVRIAQQLAQLLLIDRQRLRASFRQWRIAIVDIVSHVAEQQRRSKRRGLAGFRHMHAELALFDLSQNFDERRHVEDVAQAFAIRLEQQRKLGIPRGHGEQIVRTLAQLP